MHKSESFGSFAAGDIDKSAELPRAAHQIRGNRALRIAELYKKREDLLKRKAELEDELRAAGINPDDVLEESDVNHYTRYGNENADIYPKASEVANNSEESLAVEVHPGTVPKKAKKNRGFRKIIAGAIIGLTAMIGATAFGGFALKKNQKNISQANIAKIVNDVDAEIRGTNDKDAIEYAVVSEVVEQPTTTLASTTDIAQPSIAQPEVASTFASPDLFSQELNTITPAPSEAAESLETSVVETEAEEYRYESDQEKEENREDQSNEDNDLDDESDWDEGGEDGSNEENNNRDNQDEGEEDNKEEQSNNEVLPEPSLPESTIEQPTIEQLTVEQLVEQPTLEQPVEQPIVEQPAEQPIVEQPIVEQPTVEQLAEQPVIEQPVSEQPVIEQPVIEQPVIGEPVPEPVAPDQIVAEQVIPEQVIPEQISEPAPAPSTWGGSVLNSRNGRIQGPSGEETYYNLSMNRVVSNMHNMGFQGDYWVRDDGVKMFGNYVMVAANLNVHPRGSLVETSLGTGIVCDTGDFAASNPTQLDIATAW